MDQYLATFSLIVMALNFNPVLNAMAPWSTMSAPAMTSCQCMPMTPQVKYIAIEVPKIVQDAPAPVAAAPPTQKIITVQDVPAPPPAATTAAPMMMSGWD